MFIVVSVMQSCTYSAHLITVVLLSITMSRLIIFFIFHQCVNSKYANKFL